MEMTMSQHDVTQSSNPDVQVLLRLINALAIKVVALESDLASLPDAFVVPGPEGQLPQVVTRKPSSQTPDVLISTATANGNAGDVKPTGEVVSIKPAKVKRGKSIEASTSIEAAGQSEFEEREAAQRGEG